MSFYINNTNGNRPGPISGNPTNGICEKILRQTQGLLEQTQNVFLPMLGLVMTQILPRYLMLEILQ